MWSVAPYAELAVLGRIGYSGLLRRYPWFAFLLIYCGLTTLVLNYWHLRSGAEYAQAWAIVQIPLWILQAAQSGSSSGM